MRLEEKKKIYLMFSQSGTRFSKFLRFMTKSKYVHISLSFDEALEEVYSFGRKNPYKILPAGLVKENILALIEAYSGIKCMIYEMEIDKKIYRRLKKNLNKFLKEQDKYAYDILGLPFIYLKKRYQRKYHRVCSQFVGNLLQDSGVYDFKVHYSLITPEHFYDIPNKKLLYEGELINYITKKRQ